ncbi:MAG: hypothetical protein ACKVJK_23465, partial [Methylophagaceae bacterium]
MSYSGTVISVNGDFSTQGLEVNKYLTDATGSTGADNQVLTSTTVGGDKEIVWTTPTVGTVTNFTTVSTAIPGITTAVTNPTTTPGLTLSITGTPGAGLFLDGTGNWSSPGGGVTDITATAPLNADVATGSVTLSMPAYATATGGYVPSGGATNQYLDGLSGSWTTLPVSGVIDVAGDSVTISSTGGTTPVISAITTAGVSSISTSLATGAQIQSAIDTALSGTLTFKGTFNATTGAISSPGSGQLYTGSTGGIAITKGDFYIADTSGSFYGTTAMNVGDEAIALNTVAAGSSSVSDWSVVPAQSSGGTVTGTGAATQVAFWDGTSNINGDTAFNWDNTNKRLGIGTTNADAKFKVELNPSGTILAGLRIGYNNSSQNYFDGDTQSFRNGAGTATTMIISSNGSVGIGTPSPSAAYSIDAVNPIRGESFVLRSNSTAPAEASFIYRPATGVLGFGTASTERMRITSSGGISFGSSGTAYGTSGYVLTSAGNASPTWQPASSGASATITTRSTTTANAT